VSRDWGNRHRAQILVVSINRRCCGPTRLGGTFLTIAQELRIDVFAECAVQLTVWKERAHRTVPPLLSPSVIEIEIEEILAVTIQLEAHPGADRQGNLKASSITSSARVTEPQFNLRESGTRTIMLTLQRLQGVRGI
jgi:hypothetical protein